MTALFFYITVAAFAIYGCKKEAPDAGFDFFAGALAVFVTVWLAPLYMPFTASIPNADMPYVYFAIPVLGSVVIFGIVKMLINKLLDTYSVFDSAPAFAEYPLAAKLSGFVFGASLGYVVAALLFFALSFLPFDIPLLDKAQLAARGDRSLLVFSAKVNMFSNRKYNASQYKYMTEHREKYNKLNAPDEEKKPEAKTVAKPAVKAAAKPVVKVVSAPAPAPAPAVPQTAPQRFAAKAVSAAAGNQQRAQAAADAAKPKAAPKFACVTFKLLVPELDERGGETGLFDTKTFGIKLSEPGKVPQVIEIIVPHRVSGQRRWIRRAVRVDFSTVKYTPVAVLNPRNTIKYTIVDAK